MNQHSNSSQPADGSAIETSQARTDRIIQNAEAMLASGQQSLAQNGSSLIQSRALAAAHATADARGPLTRLCMEMADEMTAVNFEPTVEQVKRWREQLLNFARVETEGSSGG